MWYLLYR